MTDTTIDREDGPADMAADLAALRAIAEQGQRLPLLGGRHMILWGVAVTLALLVQWAITTRLLPVPMMGVAVSWFAIMGAAALVARSPFMVRDRQRAADDAGNRTERAIWTFGGLFLAVVAISLLLLGELWQARTGTTTAYLLFALMPSITFGVYAIALSAGAAAAAFPELRVPAWLALSLVPVGILTIGNHAQLLIAAAGMLGVSLLAGRTMLARERTAGRG